ncbi:MAG: MOSC domain-containing protein [Gammaproteobacteria bacterium]|nr:MOSC domain-containing protein [Gammaproteobacteria bacterium]MCY4278416.1 MOSC domain-containing protein [Gammaproteobacteria bacterium]
MSHIESICIAPEHASPQLATNRVRVQAALGLLGDRYAGRSPVTVSFIAAEEVEAFNERTGLAITAADTGRNLVTRGADLNQLVGKRFTVGEVEFEGMELCEPCATLGGRLATEEVSAAHIVREFTHRAGLRAFVRSSGELQVGDALRPI